MDIRISADTSRLSAALEARVHRRIRHALAGCAGLVRTVRAELTLHQSDRPQCWVRADLVDGHAAVAREEAATWREAVDAALVGVAAIVGARARLQPALALPPGDAPRAA